MPDDNLPRPSPFTRWQWAEIWSLAVAVVAQLLLHIAVHSLIVSALSGLISLALIVHCYSWMIPLLRKRRGTDGPS